MKKLFLLAIILLTACAVKEGTVTKSSPLLSAKQNAVSLQSYNYPTHYIRHANFLGEITPVASELDKKDSTFRMVPGLAREGYTSFESVNYPGYYLRHQGFRLKLHKPDGSQLFKEDATFKSQPGLADKSGVSFESFNYPGQYIRHKNFHLYIEKGNDDLFSKDVTFRITPAMWK